MDPLILAVVWRSRALRSLLWRWVPRSDFRRRNLDAFFRRGYRMFEDGRIPFQLFSPDVVTHQAAEVLGTVGTFRGHAGLEQVMDELYDAFEEVRFVPERVIEVDLAHVLVLIRFRARGRESRLDVDAAIAHVYTVDRGVAVALTVYWTRDQAVAAVQERARNASDDRGTTPAALAKSRARRTPNGIERATASA